MKIINNTLVIVTILVSLILALPSAAQQDFRDDNKFRLSHSFQAGIGGSNLRTDTVETNTSFLPFAGLSTMGVIMSKAFYRLGANYSLRGSTIDVPYGRYMFQYLDLQAALHFQFFENIGFELGIQPSFLTMAHYQPGTDRADRKEIKFENIHNELDAFAAVSFKLQEHLSLGVSYYYPLKNSSFSNLQFFISIPLKSSLFESKARSSTLMSYTQIEELKNGALIVRLKTSSTLIEKMEKDGKEEEARQIEKEQYRENLEIAEAFRTQYRFCPVYFFYNSSTDQFMDRDFKCIFLNDSLKADTSIHFDLPFYYLAEFGLLEAEDEEGVVSSGLSVEALIIKDKNLKQLKRPFPFYVRKHDFMAGTRSIKEMIRMLDYNLTQYYRSTLTEPR